VEVETLRHLIRHKVIQEPPPLLLVVAVAEVRELQEVLLQSLQLLEVLVA